MKDLNRPITENKNNEEIQHLWLGRPNIANMQSFIQLSIY